jgi:hypothetical protein
LISQTSEGSEYAIFFASKELVLISTGRHREIVACFIDKLVRKKNFKPFLNHNANARI